MKKLLPFVLFTFSVVIVMNAQELKVLEFRADISMTDATQYPKEDFNNERCGLVKLGLVLPDATFEGDIVSSEYRDGEWWIYMSRDANWLTIKSSNYLPLRCEFEDYEIKGIQSNVTYVMTIVSTNEYIKNSSALWRSAILPGLGQLNEGQSKGWLIMAGEVVSLAVGGYSLYKFLPEYEKAHNVELSVEEVRKAEDKEVLYGLGMGVGVVVGLGIYIYNLVDAYHTQPQSTHITLYPEVMSANGELAFGTTLIIKF